MFAGRRLTNAIVLGHRISFRKEPEATARMWNFTNPGAAVVGKVRCCFMNDYEATVPLVFVTI